MRVPEQVKRDESEDDSYEEEIGGSINLRLMLEGSVKMIQRENLEAIDKPVGQEQANILPEGNDDEVLPGGADAGNSDQRDESSVDEDESDSSGTRSSSSSGGDGEIFKEEYGEEFREFKKEIKEYKEEADDDNDSPDSRLVSSEEDEPAQRCLKPCKVVPECLPAATLAEHKRPAASIIQCDVKVKKIELDANELAVYLYHLSISCVDFPYFYDDF